MVTRPRQRTVAGLRLVAMVGSGAEGEVWDARDRTGARRALKLIRPESLVDAETVAARGRWLEHIDHPALVRVLRTGMLQGGGLDGWGFVEMEFVEGISLATAPADPEALERLEELAEGLDLLHAGTWSHGVPLVHRDIKPSNIIATEGGHLVLVDTSTLRAADTGTFTRLGTPVYAAPEVMTGRMGPPADVYSFAATALALLTGARGERLAELIAEVDDLDLPAGVRAALSARPADRPTSCQDALGDLGAEPWEVTGGWLPALPFDDVADGEDWAADFEHGDDGEGDDGDRDDGLVPLPSPVAPWVGALALLLAAPAAAWAVGGPVAGRVAMLLAATGHLALLAFGGEPFWRALLLPPVSWAMLLGDRAASTRPRRAYARALLVGALGLPVGAAAAGLRPPVAGEALVGPAAVGFTGVAVLLLVIACLAAVRGPGRVAAVVRLCLLPVWGLGAVVLVGGALALVVPGVLFGWAGPLLRLVVRTASGVVEAFRAPGSRPVRLPRALRHDDAPA